MCPCQRPVVFFRFFYWFCIYPYFLTFYIIFVTYSLGFKGTLGLLKERGKYEPHLSHCRHGNGARGVTLKAPPVSVMERPVLMAGRDPVIINAGIPFHPHHRGSLDVASAAQASLSSGRHGNGARGAVKA